MKRFLSVILTVLLMISVVPVYADAPEAFTSMLFERDGVVFTVTGTAFTSVEGGSYNLLVAAYDETDTLLTVKRDEITVSSNNATAINGKVDFADYENLDEIKTVKAMLWSSMDECRPIICSRTFDVSNGFYSYTLVSAGAASYQYDVHDNAHTSKATNLTNNDTTTGGGTAGWGSKLEGTRTNDRHIYIDLGGSQPLDRVAFYTQSARANGVEFYLSNSKPSTTWNAETDGVYLGTLEAKIDDVIESDFVLTDTQKGSYQYAIVRVPYTSGGYVTEIKAYEDTSAVYELVSTGSASYQYDVNDGYDVNKQTLLSDGDTTTNSKAGWGAKLEGIRTNDRLVYIDMGASKMLDRVKFYVQDGRSVGAEFYVSKVKPSKTWVAATDGVYLGKVSSLNTTDVVKYDFILSDTQKDSYQYAVVRVPCTSGGYVTEIQGFEMERYNLISSDADGARVHISLDDPTYESEQTTNGEYLTDGDTETKFGAGDASVACYIFIDLKDYVRIDRVETNITENRAIGQKYYLSNVKPSKTWNASTDGVYLGTLTAIGTTVFDVPSEAIGQPYRYVIADVCTAGVGGYIHELEAYEKIAN